MPAAETEDVAARQLGGHARNLQPEVDLFLVRILAGFRLVIGFPVTGRCAEPHDGDGEADNEAEAGEDPDEEQVDLWLEIPRVNTGRPLNSSALRRRAWRRAERNSPAPKCSESGRQPKCRPNSAPNSLARYLVG